jgi:hypothetical protein
LPFGATLYPLDAATVSCRWDEDSSSPRIPRIPISRAKLANGQEVVRLKIGKLTYQPVEKGKAQKKSPTTAPDPTTEGNA